MKSEVGRASVAEVLDLLIGIDNRASVSVRRAAVLECERLCPRLSQHQRRSKNWEGNQELLHMFHHQAFTLTEFHQENQVINGQKETECRFSLHATIMQRNSRLSWRHPLGVQ